MENQFSTDHINWAEKVINTCTPVAERFNLEYYPLQSKIKQSPDILFIGLNPGGGYGYNSQIKNPNWEYNDIDKRLTAERILKGNPSFDKEFHAGKWKYGNGLKKINFFKKSILEYNFVFANYVYYSSSKFAELDKIEFKDKIQENISLTLELINLINPKNIIILGTGTGIDRISKTNRLLVQGFRKRLLVQGEINGKIVYGIPHPSYNNFTEENEVISEALEKLIRGETIEPFSMSSVTSKQISKHKKKSKFDIDKFLEHFEKYKPKRQEKWMDIIVDGLNNDKILIRTNFSRNEFGIRNIDSKNYMNFISENFYNQFFNDSFERKKDNWFIRKKFSKFADINVDLVKVIDLFLSNIESERK